MLSKNDHDMSRIQYSVRLQVSLIYFSVVYIIFNPPCLIIPQLISLLTLNKIKTLVYKEYHNHFNILLFSLRRNKWEIETM